MNNYVAVEEHEIKKELIYLNTSVLKYSIKYPQFMSQRFSHFIKRLNRFYQDKAMEQAWYCETKFFSQAVDYFNEMLKGNYPFHAYEFQIEYTITFNENCILSLYFDKAIYTGGANGTVTRHSHNWNMATSFPIDLNDLYPYDKNYLSIIKEEIKFQISDQLKKDKGFFFDDWQKLVDEYFDCSNFYLTSHSLSVFFQEITIAPHASGIVVFDIPYVKGPIKLNVCH